MNSKLAKIIEDLSKEDKKNLSQRTVKLMEEVGELSKVVLPFEGAYATNHRFVSQEKILEELADVYLCHQSILHLMGFSQEELEAEVLRKSAKWASSQARERNLKHVDGEWAVPYEMHITVSASRSDLDKFKSACASLDVKPILLDLHIEGEDPIKDLMTSSVFVGNNSGAYQDMQRISEGLADLGFEVIRKKIETIPTHPAAPSTQYPLTWDQAQGIEPLMPDGCYFECHLAILCNETVEKELDDFIKNYDGKVHKSRNIFKKYDDGFYTVMLTLRDYEDWYEVFLETVTVFKADLVRYDFEVAKEIVEFALYDSKKGQGDWLLDPDDWRLNA